MEEEFPFQKGHVQFPAVNFRVCATIYRHGWSYITSYSQHWIILFTKKTVYLHGWLFKYLWLVLNPNCFVPKASTHLKQNHLPQIQGSTQKEFVLSKYLDTTYGKKTPHHFIHAFAKVPIVGFHQCFGKIFHHDATLARHQTSSQQPICWSIDILQSSAQKLGNPPVYIDCWWHDEDW